MSSALLLFSGGQDSSVCLAWALSRYEQVETIGFDYGQRHRIELDCRHEVRQRLAALSPQWQSALGADHVLDLSVLGQISDTGLTRDKAIETDAQGLPTSFVPGRNLVFLSLAAALACNRQIQRLVAGVGEADYSGYPDCRADTIAHMQQALSAGLGQPIPIETPLMYLDKAEIWELAQTLGGVALNDIIGEHTHTCYLGERTQRHRWGYGCGACPACVLRARGWESWQAKQVQT